MELSGKHILLGITGGIAAYKSAELVRLLVKQGASVQVAMSEAATRFIAPLTFQALSGKPVITDPWAANTASGMAHIALSREADLLLIAPATANCLAKLAHGLADDLLSTLALARNGPLLLAPAMNREMWSHPATQRNVATLRGDGVTLLGPACGEQACGEVGEGRMLEAAEILDAVIAHFQPRVLAGKQVLITAGPTFERIDPVRGITNLSSGKMGFAIARAAREAGAEVTLVAGPVHLPTPRGVRRIDVRSAQNMLQAVDTQAPEATIFIATAAVADWRPAHAAEHKIKKDGSGDTPTLAFVENPDILAQVAQSGRARAGQLYCVGFAAESENLLAHASAKRVRKGVPLLVGNIGPATFGQDDNALLLVDAQGHRELPRAPKSELGRQLVAEIARRLGEAGAPRS